MKQFYILGNLESKSLQGGQYSLNDLKSFLDLNPLKYSQGPNRHVHVFQRKYKILQKDNNQQTD